MKKKFNHKEWARQYYQKNKENIKLKCHNYYLAHKPQAFARIKKERRAIKREVLTHYGNGKLACVQCGFDNIAALTIDHINNDGASDRNHTTHQKVGHLIYRWLKNHNYPEGYQTLCMNCQWVKRREVYRIKYNQKEE